MVIDKLRGALTLVACDAAALALGLAPGVTLADARARHPVLDVVQADREADQRLVLHLAQLCDRFTPLVALDPPHGLMLDVSGCAHLFGGESGLGRMLRARIERAGLSVRMALAGTPEAARAFGRFGRGGICPPGEEERRAQTLPLAALEAPPETALALSRAGLKRLGDLAGRPSTVLAARFGEAITGRLARILGHEDRRITPLRPLPACLVERQFMEPLWHGAGIEQALADLAVEVACVLEQRGEGGRVFEIGFFRSDGAVRRLTVETGRPMRDPTALMRLLDERLDTLADPLDCGFGFDAIRFAVPLCEPLAPAQPSLDGRVVEERAVADLVDRLVARFGRDRVQRFAARDSHDPERAARALPATGADPGPTTQWLRPEPGEPPRRPVHLFDPPQPIETLAEVPDGPPLRFRWRRVLHDITRAEGPERIAPEWWREGAGGADAGETPARDYYRVEDVHGCRFWVFRRGLYGGGEETAPRWFLHGLFA